MIMEDPMKTAPFILSCILMMLLASCGTLQTHEGPEQPPESVAIIKANPRSMLDQVVGVYDQATVHAVDGVESGISQIHAEVLPGEHAITIRLDKVRGPVFHWTYITLTLNAKAGHRYIVDGQMIDEDNVYAWIIDKETGLVVAGEKHD
jgi:hypothetical protein